MESIILTDLYLITPLFIAGVLHMIVVKKNLFPSLRIPIHKWAFGENKTWRGLIVMAAAGIAGVWAAIGLFDERTLLVDFNSVNPTVLGTSLGLAYALAELPNSFIKRRLGAAPGQSVEKYRWFFFLLDHVDSLTGVMIVYDLYFDLGITLILATILLGPVIHTLVNFILWSLGVRKDKT